MTSGAVTADGRARVLADGSQMPMLGLGVWQVPNGPECVNAVRWALDLGVFPRTTEIPKTDRRRSSVGGLTLGRHVTVRKIVVRGLPGQRGAAPHRQQPRHGVHHKRPDVRGRAAVPQGIRFVWFTPAEGLSEPRTSTRH